MTEFWIPLVWLTTIFFGATMLQTITGFGFALIVMPLVTLVLGLPIAAPLVALTGLTLYAINVVRYRNALIAREVTRLGIAAALGVPVGVWALTHVDEAIIKTLLGAILIGYALYSWARPFVMPGLSLRWSLLAGFLSGCLGGAFNMPGPPLIVYGSLQAWGKDEFRGVLQALFFISSLLTVALHMLAQRVTPSVLTFYACAVPALGLGIFAGARLDRRVNRERFRALVIGMILLLGVSLLWRVGA